MKKTVLISALALAATIGASAKTADELRVYINPGHGAWTGNDRPATLVGHGAYSRTNTDTLSFFETNTNLQKGFGLLESLKAAGVKFDATLNQTGEDWQIGAARDLSNNIVMSRVKNGPYLPDNATGGQYESLIEAQEAALAKATTEEERAAIQAKIEELKFLDEVVSARFDRNLSEVAAEATANNFDIFISIHSNAATEGTTTNYPLFLYSGYDTPKTGTGYVTVEKQTHSKAMCQAAWAYAFENSHGMWTYYSATNMNVRGDLNFYSTTSTSGYLGVLKSSVPGYLVEGYFHTYQPARHRAMNWDACRIEGYAYARGVLDYFGIAKDGKGSIYGVVRDKYTKFTDAAYKPNLTTADAYKPLNGVKVILKKDGKEVATYTTDNYYNGVYVFRDLEPGTYTVEFDSEAYQPLDAPQEVVVKADAVTYPTSSLVDVNWAPPAIVYENYPNTVVPGTIAADEYTFAQSYVDEAIAGLEGKTVRRVIAKGENLYILAHDEAGAPTIVVYDAKNKAVVANVSTEGTQGTVKAVSDIQVSADGVLLATNENLNHYDAGQVQSGETRGYNRIYRWENDKNGLPTGKPVELGSSVLSGNFYRAYVGGSFAFSGTLEDGSIIVPAYTAATTSTHKFFYNLYSVVDGTIKNGKINNAANETYLTSEHLGEGYTFTTSPLDDSKFVATSSIQSPVEFNFGDVQNGYAAAPAGVADGSASVAFFRYNNHAYMVTAENAEGKNTGIKLTDVTAGFDKAESVATINTALAEGANGHVAASVTKVLDLEENVTAAYLNLYVVRDGKVSRLTTEGVAQPVYRANLAYGLKAAESESAIEFQYTLNGDAVSAEIVLTPSEGDAIVVEGEATKGAHTATIDKAQLNPGVEYAWEVKVASKSNAAMGEVFSAAPPQTVRGSIVTFTDPEYDAFGYTVVGHNVENGFDIYNPEGELVESGVHKGSVLHGGGANFNQSNPFRGDEHMGHALVACWGDAAWGVTAFNPVNTSEELYSVFEGEKASSGKITYNGVAIGGGTSCVAIQGKGENARMFTFDEDVLGNQIAVYNIGANRTITTAPTAWGQLGLANTNVDIQCVENGIFATQVRNDFMDAAPAIEFISNEGAVLWKSGSATWPADMIKDCNSGLAVNKQGTLLAVSGTTGIRVFDLSFDDKNCPVLTYRAGISVPSTAWATMRFDAANNLHYYGRGTGYKVFAINVENPVASTVGKGVFCVAAAVEDIAIDNVEDAPAVYYNLNGVQIDAANLVPGVYVKVVGSTATKVVVK